MSAQEQFAALLVRIAAATSIIRTRADDAVRRERNMEAGEIDSRLLSILPRLEKVAAELEEALAA